MFLSCIEAYKYANKHYNGFYQFNNRHSDLFLGSAIKRANKLTPRIVLAHLANIPGEGVCRKFFTEKECEYCGWMGSYMYNSDVNNLAAYTTKESRNSTIFLVALNKIKEHPFQYMFFIGYEATRMLFWESTNIGYVQYPQIITKLYKATWFRYGIRLTVAVLTCVSVFYLLINLYRRRINLLDRSEGGESVRVGLFTLLVMASYIGVYSLCYALTRYALPIGSLYLLSIAYCCQNIKWPCSKWKN
jgi:hypothetical protein